MSRLRRWSAGVGERRVALAVFFVALLVAASALLRPDLWQHLAPDGTTDTASSQPRYDLPRPEAPAPSGEETTPRENPATTDRSEPETATEPGSAAAPPETRNATAGYFVQVGAFRDADHAEKLAARLREAGRETRIAPRRGLRAVRVGPFDSRREAETELERLRAQHELKGFVVRAE